MNIDKRQESLEGEFCWNKDQRTRNWHARKFSIIHKYQIFTEQVNLISTINLSRTFYQLKMKMLLSHKNCTWSHSIFLYRLFFLGTFSTVSTFICCTLFIRVFCFKLLLWRSSPTNFPSNSSPGSVWPNKWMVNLSRPSKTSLHRGHCSGLLFTLIRFIFKDSILGKFDWQHSGHETEDLEHILNGFLIEMSNFYGNKLANFSRTDQKTTTSPRENSFFMKNFYRIS